MELPAGVVLWLGSSLEKRAGATVPENPIQALTEALEALRLTKYLVVVVLTFVFYDIALTYRREVQLIWGSRWTIVRVLFTIARYFVPCVLLLNITFTFHPHVPAEVCRVEMKVMAGTGILCNAAMMCILLLRVWTIWGRRSWILALLLLVFVGSQMPPAFLIARTLQKLDVIENPLPGLLTGCVVTEASSVSTSWTPLFVSSLVYESILLLLTVTQAWNLSRNGVGTPIVTLLTRDGAWYFLVVIASVALTIFGASIPKTQMAALLSQFFIGIISCTCCRLLLRLREFCTPTDQSTGDGGLSRSPNEISMQLYTYRRASHLVPSPMTSNFSFTHSSTDVSSKSPV